MKSIKVLCGILVLGFLANCTKQGNFNFSSTALGGDTYNEVGENPFIQVIDQAISTFSIDADGASYANVRRYIQQDNQLPPLGAVRTEELINYFELDYSYTDPSHPIAMNGEVSQCPWNKDNKLVRIGIKGKPIAEHDLPPSNFVFLIDVSGSMKSADKLDLLKIGFKQFVDQLDAKDKVAIVTYAGSSGVLLNATSGNKKTKINNAINGLGAGGSTAGAEGIITAYKIAQDNFIPGGNNRVILGSDGDFNVGPSSQDELVDLIKSKRDQGIFLTTLGVGRGNLNDAAMEQIANNGNGTYEYIDNIRQLSKVFIHEFDKFYTVAKDVKVQVEFNDENVEAYRLIGYENRLLDTEDFDNDDKDAGEIGANQNITALYEIVPKSNPNFKNIPTFSIDFRYKNPNSNNSILLDLEIYDEGKSFDASTDYMRFTAGVSAYSMLITNSQYKGSCTYDSVLTWVGNLNLADKHGFKSEFKNLVSKSKGL